MKLVDSTWEILAFKMLGRGIGKKWVDWAYEMLSAGFETENLVILAGETEPFNQFELQRLTDKIFAELNLNWSDRDKVLRGYVCYLINQALIDADKMDIVLSTLKDLCIETDYDRLLYDFYLFYFAKEDLKFGELQCYWDNATRENINGLIIDYFTNWVKSCR